MLNQICFTHCRMLGLVKLLLAFMVIVDLCLTPPLFGQEDFDEEISFFELEEMFINMTVTSAGKKEEKIGQIPASIVIVTRDEIERYGYRSLSEILENIPGLYNIDGSWIKLLKRHCPDHWPDPS